MSYKATVYFNDADIDSTEIYYANGGFTVNREYGSDQYSAQGFSGSIKFTAYPAANCSFTRWVYRLGSTTGTVQYSYSNPFTYTGSQDIYIRAEGEQDSVQSPWTDWNDAVLEVTTFEQNIEVYNAAYDTYELLPYNVHRYTVNFAYSGYAHFYTSSDIDTLGYLSTDPEWDSDYSGPWLVIASDDDSGDGSNFDIKYNVTAGVDYYLYVRGCTGEESGYVSVGVTEPWRLSSKSYGTLSAENSEIVSLSRCTLYCRTVSFTKTGKVTIRTTGSIHTIGWLGTTSEWDRGRPTSYIEEDDGFGETSPNFSMSYDVQAGTTYYIWFRGWGSGGASGVTNLKISDVEEEIAVDKWSWSAPNGSASKQQTSDAYSAVVNKYDTRNFSHLVWNDMVDKVYEIILASTKWWDSTYATYNDTKMHSAPYELTAVMFNSLRNNIEIVANRINLGYTTGIGRVYPNDEVYGYYFTTLTDYMNDCIDKL